MPIPPRFPDFWLLLAIISFLVAVGWVCTWPCMEALGGCDVGYKLEFLP